MAGPSDVIVIHLDEEQIALARKHARLAEIGGRSHIRGAEDRAGMLPVDQIVGQVGTLAGILWLTGSAVEYERAREAANRNPTVGDGGSDILGANIDFKASLQRSDRPPERFSLLVRPGEHRHRGVVYILAVVKRDYSKVALVGWARESELPAEVVPVEGLFGGAHRIPGESLHPLPPFRWSTGSKKRTDTGTSSENARRRWLERPFTEDHDADPEPLP